MEEKLAGIKAAVEQLERLSLTVPYSDRLPEVRANFANTARLVNLMHADTNAAFEGADVFGSSMWNTPVNVNGISTTLEQTVRDLQTFIETQIKWCPACNHTREGNLENECNECGGQLSNVPPHTAPVPKR